MNLFPGNKKFAFTIFDDTDGCTVQAIEPVYRFLAEIGIFTTKSVWPLPQIPNGRFAGVSLDDKSYRDFVLSSKAAGFEIALHNVRQGDSPREVIDQGFERFRDLFGQYPRIHCNHSMNRENIYWGPNRLETPAIRLTYNLATRFSHRRRFEGHLPQSPYFWGDICKEKISYVRNFVFDEINLDRINPSMPYHDPRKPFVNYWFSSSEGNTVVSFCKMLSEANQDRLEAEGGVCIMYTHFAHGFCEHGMIHSEFKRLMRRLTRMNGWFAPVATVLDHLQKNRGILSISRSEVGRMERRWLLSKMRKGTT